jgi:hypothetical protein
MTGIRNFSALRLVIGVTCRHPSVPVTKSFSSSA